MSPYSESREEFDRISPEKTEMQNEKLKPHVSCNNYCQFQGSATKTTEQMLEEDLTKGGKDEWWELCSTCWNYNTKLQIQRD